MDQVRRFARSDVPAVADLWVRVFRQSDRSAPDAVRRYFDDVFFANPLADEELPSLVCEDGTGRTIAFLGVMPRRLMLGERLVRMAVATQLMVERCPKAAFVALALVRRLFHGPQELTFSDGGNEWAFRIWRRLGADVVRLQSIEWRRILRPAAFLLDRVEVVRRSLPWAIAPVSRPLDELASRLPVPQLRRPQSSLVVEDLTESDLCQLIALRRESLRPVYDPAGLRWIFECAAETQGHGSLHRKLVRDQTAKIAGWFIYYTKRGGIARVLQVGATEGETSRVLDALFADARRVGSVAVTGQLMPQALTELSDAGCTLSCPGLDVFAHSRDEGVLRALHRGDSFLSRLDGEWWLRFGADWRELPSTGTAASPQLARVGV